MGRMESHIVNRALPPAGNRESTPAQPRSGTELAALPQGLRVWAALVWPVRPRAGGRAGQCPPDSDPQNQVLAASAFVVVFRRQ